MRCRGGRGRIHNEAWAVRKFPLSGERIPTFDWRRWGLGSMITNGGFLSFGSITLLKWAFDPSKGFLFLSVILVGAGAFVFLVKASEEMRTDSIRRDVVGQVGETVRDIRRNNRGVVRIRGELWSATSKTDIGVNQKVRVVGSEGLCVWVDKLE